MATAHGSSGRGWLELKVRRSAHAAALECRVRARARGGVTLCMHTRELSTHAAGSSVRCALRGDAMPTRPARCPQVLGTVGVAAWQSVWVELRFDVRCSGACAAGPCRLGSCRTRRALLLLHARGASPALTLGWGLCFDRTSQR